MFEPIDLTASDDDEGDAQTAHVEHDSEGEFFNITSRRPRRPGVVVHDDESMPSEDEEEDRPLRNRKKRRQEVVFYGEDYSDRESDDEDAPLSHRKSAGKRPAPARPSSGGAGPSSSSGACAQGIALDHTLDDYALCKSLTDASLCAEDLRRLVRHKLDERFSPSELQWPIPADLINALPGVYDKVFFKDTLLASFRARGCSLATCWNRRCQKTGGFCKTDPKKRCAGVQTPVTIELSFNVFAEAAKALQNGMRIKSNGLVCDDIVDSILYTFEHELLHAVMACFCRRYIRANDGPKGDPVRDAGGYILQPSKHNGHSATFLSMMQAMFGHRTFRHNLTGRPEADVQKPFKKGQRVRTNFRSKSGSHIEYEGTVLAVYKKSLKVSFDAQHGSSANVRTVTKLHTNAL
jgi:hypothetical protein